MLRSRADWAAIFFCLLFIALGCAWIGELGLQMDEVLFARAVYPPYRADIELLGKTRPLMLMDYVGAAKAYIWKPIMRNLGASAATVRVPAVVLGALTIWLFYLLVKRTLGVRTALTATALLSVDTNFVLTSRWDWGPVVLQHLLAVAGVLSVLQFSRDRRKRWLAIGFVLLGLGAWDKALFFWTFSGLAVATAAVFPRRVWRLLTWRNVAVATGSLAVGAMPLIVYNVKYPLATFRQSSWSWQENVGQKARAFVITLQGGGLLGSIVREEWDGPVREPDDAIKRAWVSTARAAGMPRTNGYAHLAGLALALAPFVWRSTAARAVLFVLIYCAVAWVQMAFTVGAGGSTHHTVLLWPFPHLAIAAVLAEVSRRLGRSGIPALAFVAVTACLSSLAVIGTTYTNMLRNGGVKEWTDAIYPAAAAVQEMKPAFVCVLDWGLYENTFLLSQGRTSMCAAPDPAADPDAVKEQIRTPGIVYITHTEANRLYPEITKGYLSIAESEGFRIAESRVLHDYNGRPIIEVFKLYKP
ncbi:MAG TPA: glycosyltransferase family 39 protein [Bryobacteraceae bacterium]|nr:glycosyltransferase family 39 protein [Bryobacteraceae bacterium]